MTQDGKKETIPTEDYEALGEIKIADEVVATIASLAALEVAGVAGMIGGMTAGITEMLGKKSVTKGVKVEVDNNKVSLDLSLLVRYGSKIPAVCMDIQNNVAHMVETMSGLQVKAVNVFVHGVVFEQEEKLQDKGSSQLPDEGVAEQGEEICEY